MAGVTLSGLDGKGMIPQAPGGFHGSSPRGPGGGYRSSTLSTGTIIGVGEKLTSVKVLKGTCAVNWDR